jgi:hypothetical protein
MATAEEPVIGTLVTDSAFAELNRLLQVEFPRSSGLPSFFLPGAYLMGRVITGEDLSVARPAALIGAITPRQQRKGEGCSSRLVSIMIGTLYPPVTLQRFPCWDIPASAGGQQ